jgi:HEPN domain-containing protein
MSDPKIELVRTWLLKAQHDLAAAEKLALGPEPYLDVAIYHCQQAAEKAVKAFLLHCDEPFGKTHDLGALVSLAATRDARLEPWVDAADALTPYATMYRYPSEHLEPDQEDFDQALQAAGDFCQVILGILPPDQPQEVPADRSAAQRR